MTKYFPEYKVPLRHLLCQQCLDAIPSDPWPVPASGSCDHCGASRAGWAGVKEEALASVAGKRWDCGLDDKCAANRYETKE